jgi:hypothetical protein
MEFAYIGSISPNLDNVVRSNEGCEQWAPSRTATER